MIKRGQIYWVDLQTGVEHLNRGFRPCLVVSNDKCNEHSTVIQIVPLTTSNKKAIPTHTTSLVKGNVSTILWELVTSIDKRTIDPSNYIMTLSYEVMDNVTLCLMKQLGIMEA